MLAPCEEIYKVYIPAIKAKVIRILRDSYGMTQVEIAQCLGMTQAAVSKSLTGKHSLNVIQMMERKDVIKFSDQMARKIVKKKLRKNGLAKEICKQCLKINFDGKSCMIKQIAKLED